MSQIFTCMSALLKLLNKCVNKSWRWDCNVPSSLDHKRLFNFPHDQVWITDFSPSLYPPADRWQVHGEDKVLLSHTCGTEGSTVGTVRQYCVKTSGSLNIGVGSFSPSRKAPNICCQQSCLTIRLEDSTDQALFLKLRDKEEGETMGGQENTEKTNDGQISIEKNNRKSKWNKNHHWKRKSWKWLD